MDPVQSLLTDYDRALTEKNVDLLVDLYDEEVLMFDTWDQWTLSGKDAWRGMVRDWFGSLGSESVRADFEVVQQTASETLISFAGFVTYTALSAEGEKLRSNKERITWVLALQSTGWKIVHCHNSMPVDMRTGKSVSSDQP